MGEHQISYIPPFFYPHFISFHISIPLIKPNLNQISSLPKEEEEEEEYISYIYKNGLIR